MRRQRRQYTTELPCTGTVFLARIRLNLENAPPGRQIYTDTASGRLYAFRDEDGYTLSIGGKAHALELTATQAGYGLRYWYACPRCARRCSKLYIGRQDVACRQCWDLHYESQSEDAEHRMMRAVRRKRLALWGTSEPYAELMNLGLSANLFFKPKGMHWRTFEAQQEALRAFESLFWQRKLVILRRRFPGAF